MFPIRDNIHAQSFPVINWMILILNALVFFIQSNLSPIGLNSFLENWALIPVKIDPQQPLSLLPFLTHFWLHGSLFHFISNMWMLFIFGDNVEDKMGSIRYFLFYILGGVGSGFLQYYFSQYSTLPAIGASGAIAAVMGAYFLFYPRSKVVTFVPILLFIWFVNIPSFIFLGIWFGSQLLNGVAELSAVGEAMSNVAWWAHIGGFLFGLILGYPFTIGLKKRRNHADEYYPW